MTVLAELEQLCARFDAVPVRILGARYGFVLAVTTPTGDLVMRASPDPAGLIQADVSRALAKHGVGPVIHDVSATPTGTWTVMDQIHPGTRLSSSELSDRPATIATVLCRLRGQPAPLPNMPSVAEWLHKRLRSGDASDLAPGRTVAPINERLKALSVLDNLMGQSNTKDLCHGDLQLGNLLMGSEGQVFLIDPRGVSGELAYDVAVLALKATARGALVEARMLAARLADHVGVDSDRAQAWVTVASAARV